MIIYANKYEEKRLGTSEEEKTLAHIVHAIHRQITSDVLSDNELLLYFDFPHTSFRNR